jgi:hypothetical protein
MGCDIHTMAEINYGDGWREITAAVFDSSYFSPDQEISVHNVPHTSVPYSGRNYRLFSRLADVRNGYGFAGVDTGDYITPLAEPRGIPADASKGWRDYAEDDVDLHSATYFTARELIDADWDFPITIRGVVSEEQYIQLKSEGKSPESWAGGISAGNSITVTEAEYELGIRAPKGERTFVQMEWTQSFREFAQSFIDIFPRLISCAPLNIETREPDLDRIRIMICFDN